MCTRPILRYHGGKWKLADWIIGNIPNHRIYVEPFGGAASVLLKKPRSYAEIYNDMDGEIVNLFRVARDQGEELLRLLRTTPFARDEFLLSYERSDNPVEQARRTVVRAFMGFGSNAHNKITGFRSNCTRSGTTPAIDWRNYPQALEKIIDRLNGVVIENRDARKVMATHDGPETVHYVDPPYVMSTRGPGKDYRFEMNDSEHEQLLADLNQLNGMVVLSGYDCDLYEDMCKGWRKVARTAFADGARERVEVLWLSPNCPSNSLFDMLA